MFTFPSSVISLISNWHSRGAMRKDSDGNRILPLTCSQETARRGADFSGHGPECRPHHSTHVKLAICLTSVRTAGSPGRSLGSLDMAESSGGTTQQLQGSRVRPTEAHDNRNSATMANEPRVLRTKEQKPLATLICPRPRLTFSAQHVRSRPSQHPRRASN